MSRKSSRQLEDERRLAERAAEWVAVLAEANADERAEFVRWIQESPLHLQEFLMASAVVRGLSNVDLGIEPLELDSTHSNVVHLSPTNDPAHPVSRRHLTQWSLAAGVAAIAIILTALSLQWFDGSQTYRTGIGEQRTLHLSDGSIVQMNVGSRVKVSYTDNARRIQLTEGEALFTVKRESQRPFRVYAGESVIEALGTQFNVRRRTSGTLVSVTEGLVQVSDGSGSTSAMRLKAGEAARVNADGRIGERAAVNLKSVATWRQQRLDFRAERLADIAVEFNQYNTQPQVVVLSTAAGQQRYSGVFDAHDPRALVDFLREDPSLAVEESEARIVIRDR